MLDELIKALDKKLSDEGRCIYSIVVNRDNNCGSVHVFDDFDGEGQLLYSEYDNTRSEYDKSGVDVSAERIIKKLA